MTLAINNPNTMYLTRLLTTLTMLGITLAVPVAHQTSIPASTRPLLPTSHAAAPTPVGPYECPPSQYKSCCKSLEQTSKGIMQGLGTVLPILNGVQISSLVSFQCMFTDSAAAAVLARFFARDYGSGHCWIDADDYQARLWLRTNRRMTAMAIRLLLCVAAMRRYVSVLHYQHFEKWSFLTIRSRVMVESTRAGLSMKSRRSIIDHLDMDLRVRLMSSMMRFREGLCLPTGEG